MFNEEILYDNIWLYFRFYITTSNFCVKGAVFCRDGSSHRSGNTVECLITLKRTCQLLIYTSSQWKTASLKDLHLKKHDKYSCFGNRKKNCLQYGWSDNSQTLSVFFIFAMNFFYNRSLGSFFFPLVKQLFFSFKHEIFFTKIVL